LESRAHKHATLVRVFPLVFDCRLVVFRFLQFLPLVVIFQIVYLWTRRLPRMIMMHSPMDLFAALTLRYNTI
jgi:hypothetical protein